ncbi:MAG: adenosylcobinamide-GDP ribazoletransferase [Alphaproteobacteria bacterium]
MDRKEENGQGDSRGLGGWLTDLQLAAAFLTRLPLPSPAPSRTLASAARVFPLVGAAVGLAGGVVFLLAAGLGLPPWLAAVAALATTVAVTGALHEDGLSDLADGLGAGLDREAKLAAMQDSGAGPFGVVALVLALVARVAALAALEQPAIVVAALVAAGAVSRVAIVGVMRELSPARDEGLGAAAGTPPRDGTLIALALAAVIALILVGPATGFVAVTAAGLTALGVAALAQRQLGGYTGDVLGAVQQVAEIAFLIAVVAVR